MQADLRHGLLVAPRNILLVAAIVAPGCGGSTPAAPGPEPPPTAPSGPRPSFVLVVADDLDTDSMPELDTLEQHFRSDGLTFTRAYATHPQCTPSRASLLTGQYTHNHGVFENEPPIGGYAAFRALEPETIVTRLHAAGYRTGLVGKYLNGYPDAVPMAEAIPPGWDRWYAHVTSYVGGRYFDYWVNDQGALAYRGSAPEDYDTDVLAQVAEQFVRDSTGSDAPFLLLVTPHAPHIRPIASAPRHDGYFTGSEVTKGPSFDEEDVSDKPAFVQVLPRLTPADVRRLDEFQKGRLRSMLAVEELIARLLSALDETGQLGHTYVIFTSDHGFSMGTHRLQGRKNNFYEESIHIPLMIRGPGVARGRQTDALVELLDLPITILDLAGIPGEEALDGRSLAPILGRGEAPASWREDVLLEAFTSELGYGLRTRDYLYTELNAVERELYDMRVDPHQLDNLILTVEPDLVQGFSARLHERRSCRAESCRE